jgi:hypothetical protein
VCDRYTIFPRGRGWGAFWNRSKDERMRLFLGLSENPTSPHGFSQWGKAWPGRHLGKRIAWADLPEHIRRHASSRIAE